MNKFIKQAFTLIELLVVIAIIGILSGLIIVGMNGMTQKATIAKAQVFSSSLRNSLMANLVSEWKFDGSAADGAIAINTDVLDTWGGNNGDVGTHQPTVKTTFNCVSGSCMYFNGNSINLGNLNINSQGLPFSVFLWIKTTQTGASDDGSIFFSKRTGTNTFCFNFEINSLRVSNWTANYPTETVIGSKVINNNNWHYVGFVWNGTIVSLYVDGVIDGTKVLNLSTQSVANGTSLGAFDSGVTRSYNGFMDDVRVYSAIIPTSQIKEQYYAGLNKLLADGGIIGEEYQNRVGELAIR